MTYPANFTENYTVVFNFSDIKPLIQNGNIIPKHGVKNVGGVDVFYFMLTQNMSRDPLGSGNNFVIDPTFGCDPSEFGSGTSAINAVRHAVGGKFTMGSVVVLLIV